jgi:hypothetical protein
MMGKRRYDYSLHSIFQSTLRNLPKPVIASDFAGQLSRHPIRNESMSVEAYAAKETRKTQIASVFSQLLKKAANPGTEGT